MLSAIRSRAVVLPISARAFSTSRAAADLSKVTLIGRLGADPQKLTTTSGKPYYTYPVATAVGAPVQKEDGTQVPQTSWHTVFAFNEATHEQLARAGKGSTVYVEAELEMRPSDGQTSDGRPLPDRALLRHQRMSIISRKPPASEGGETAAE